MAENLSSMSTGDLRKRLRKEFPQCRGAFAAQAHKDECIAVLTRAEKPDAVMARFRKRLAGGSDEAEQEQVEVLAEGVGGDNPPPDGESHASSVVAPGLEQMLQAMATLNPTAAAEVQRMMDDEKARRTAVDTTTELEATGKSIKISGLDVPVVLARPTEGDANPSPNWAYVPPTDPLYRFDIWRASRTCGAVVFQQSAADIIKMLIADKRIMLVGPPSCGKTSLIDQFAARCQWPVTRFNGNRDVTVQDFVGCYEARQGSTEWVDGPLVYAMKHGHILLLDEVDHMPAECSSVLHSVLEPGGKLVITANGGEVVKPHKNLRIVATANTAGFGDESGIHPNAQVQDAAFLSRWEAVVRVAWMEARHEEQLLVKAAGIERKDAKAMVAIANDTRKSVAKGDMLYPITLRQTMAWASLTSMLDLASGFAIAVLNKLPSNDVAAVAEIAQRHAGNHFGGKLVADEAVQTGE